MAQPRRVCIAVDGGPASAAALEWAARSLVGGGDAVRLFTVVPPSQPGSSGSALVPVASWPAEGDPAGLERAAALLQSSQARMAALGVQGSQMTTDTVVATVGTAQDIGRVIVRYASECGCETVVVGSRGLGLSRRALLDLFGVGSVSHWVANHAPCNVAVHKDPKLVRAAAEAAQERVG